MREANSNKTHQQSKVWTHHHDTLFLPSTLYTDTEAMKQKQVFRKGGYFEYYRDSIMFQSLQDIAGLLRPKMQDLFPKNCNEKLKLCSIQFWYVKLNNMSNIMFILKQKENHGRLDATPPLICGGLLEVALKLQKATL